MAPWTDAPTPHRPCQRVRPRRDRVPRDRSGRPGGPRPAVPLREPQGHDDPDAPCSACTCSTSQDGVFPTVPVGSIRLWDNADDVVGDRDRRRTSFDWTKLDAAVDTARGNGVNDILMVLAGTPAWAHRRPGLGRRRRRPARGGGHAQGPGRLGRLGAPGGDPLQGPDHRVPALERGQPRHLLHRNAPGDGAADQARLRHHQVASTRPPPSSRRARAPGSAARSSGSTPPTCASSRRWAGRSTCGPPTPTPPPSGTPVDRAGLARTFQSRPRRRGRPGPADLGHREQLRPGRSRGREPRPGHRRPAGRGLDRAHLPRRAAPGHQPGVLVRLGPGERSRRHPDEHRAAPRRRPTRRCRTGSSAPRSTGARRPAATTSPAASPRTARSSGSCTRRSAAPPSRRRASARSARSTGRASRSPRRRSGRSARSSCASSPLRRVRSCGPSEHRQTGRSCAINELGGGAGPTSPSRTWPRGA